MAHLIRHSNAIASSRRSLSSIASSLTTHQSRSFHPRPTPTPTSSRTLTTTTTSPRYHHNHLTNPKTPSSPLQSRPYHSEHHPSQPHEYTNSQTTILSAALRHIPTHGFSNAALTLGARDAGFLDVSVQLFPRAEFDLVLFWLASRRGLLRAAVDDGVLEKVGAKTVDEKIRALVVERLRMNEDVRLRWQDALALMSLPSNIPLSLSELHALSSDILSLAGDESVDTAWYTKRLSVSAIYASAEVIMTREGADMATTEEFVDRRFEDAQAVGEKLGGMKQCAGFLGMTAVGLGRSWGLKI